MHEYLYSIALSYVATIMALSGFRSYITSTVNPNHWSSAPLLLKVAKNKIFCIMSMSVAIVMFTFDNIYICLVCTSFSSAVIGIGMLLDNSGKCGCFGGSSRLSKRKILFIRINALLASALIFFLVVEREVPSYGLNWLRLGVGVALLFYFLSLLIGKR